MEQQSSTPLYLLLGLPLIAIFLAIVAYVVTRDERPERAAETAASEPAPMPEPAPPTSASSPQVARVPPAPAAAPSAPPAAAPPAVPTPPPEPVYDSGPPAAVFNDPKIREHAQLIAIENARLSIQQGNVERLRQLRETLSDQRVASAIPPNILDGMDVAIACMTQAAGFRSRAEDYLEDNPSAPLTASVREACK
jgi:pyruvate/2-oxoglutarate dehydrogenase complex dihydrolipoamide acyltransferase (E2) component